MMQARQKMLGGHQHVLRWGASRGGSRCFSVPGGGFEGALDGGSSAAHAALDGVSAPFLRAMFGRGFVHQCTDQHGLDEVLLRHGDGNGGDRGEAHDVVSAYIGFDATATSLHVGNLLQLMMLRLFQQCGHRPVLLLGGGTTLVGDPSGRDASRQLLDEDTIASNAASLARCFGRFVDFAPAAAGTATPATPFGKPTDALLLNNSEWLAPLELLPFLRDVGARFPLSKLLGYEASARRLREGHPYTFLEFSYVLLQAYDFMELHRRHGVCLQLGGSDQWGNIVAGVELARRTAAAEAQEQEEEDCGGPAAAAAATATALPQQLFGLTAPLLTTADGKKMGKSVAGPAGTVWLDPALTPPFAYWQYWRNVADADVGRMLRLFTDLPLAQLDEIAPMVPAGEQQQQMSDEQLNLAKGVLADEATKLLHGEEAAAAAHTAARSLFTGGKGGERGGATVEAVEAAGGPEVMLGAAELAEGGGVLVTELLVRLGLTPGKKAARRLVEGGGVRLGGKPVTDVAMRVGEYMLATGAVGGLPDATTLSVGKKKHGIVRAEEK